MLTSLIAGNEPAFISITKPNGDTRPLTHHSRHRSPAPAMAPPVNTGETVRSLTDTDVFYDCLQGIWERVLRFEDLGIIHNESDKFRYAYQLAEAELRDLCLKNAALHR